MCGQPDIEMQLNVVLSVEKMAVYGSFLPADPVVFYLECGCLPNQCHQPQCRGWRGSEKLKSYKQLKSNAQYSWQHVANEKKAAAVV